MQGSPLVSVLVWIALAITASSPLACGRAKDASGHEVAVGVQRVGLDAHDLPVVLLEERDGSRWLAIWIGTAEAESIAMSIEEIASPRPNSHDLARSVIDGLHGELERVVVTDLREGTYYATLAIRAGGQRVEIDARPSDAIAIALRTHAPIFVREHLLERPASDAQLSDSGPSI